MIDLSGKRGLVVGVANEASIAAGCARAFRAAGAELALTCLNEKARPWVAPVAEEVGADLLLACDVREPGQLEAVFDRITAEWGRLDFLLHAIAFAPKEDLQTSVVNASAEGFALAMDVSCHSFLRMARLARPLMQAGGSLITVSFYGADRVVENYNLMGPVKAALESSLCFLAKSFSAFSEVRFNAVCPGLLKTSASAGIPGYVDSYLFAEQATLRKRALQTDEASNVAAFLLSPRSSGMTGQCLVVDGGMGLNYFDQAIVSRVVG